MRVRKSNFATYRHLRCILKLSNIWIHILKLGDLNIYCTFQWCPSKTQRPTCLLSMNWHFHFCPDYAPVFSIWRVDMGSNKNIRLNKHKYSKNVRQRCCIIYPKVGYAAVSFWLPLKTLTLALARGSMRPPWGFSRCTPNYEADRAEILHSLWGVLCAKLDKKFWPGHVMSRSYDVTSGTRSGHFCEK